VFRVPWTLKICAETSSSGRLKHEVRVRLRYRLREGKLAFTFKLVNPERVIEDAFNSVGESVKASVAEAIIYDAQA